jgi:hypothetical protein
MPAAAAQIEKAPAAIPAHQSTDAAPRQSPPASIQHGALGWKSVLVAAIAGTIVSIVISLSFAPRASLTFNLLTGIGAGIGMAIGRNLPRGPYVVVVGGALGWVVGTLLMGPAAGAVFGAPLGAVLGPLGVRLWNWNRRHRRSSAGGRFER